MDDVYDTTDASLVVGGIYWNEVCDEYDGERIRKLNLKVSDCF